MKGLIDDIRLCHSQQRIPWFEAQRERLEIERIERKCGYRPPLRAIVISMDENGKIHKRTEDVV